MPCVRLGKRRSLLAARKARRRRDQPVVLPAEVGIMADDATLVTFPTGEENAPRLLEDGDNVELRQPRPAMEESVAGEEADGELMSDLNRAVARLNEQGIAEPEATLAAEPIKEEAAESVAPVFAKKPSHSDIINAESRIGSLVFGPIPEGHRREFFHDRENIWIWYEGWSDEQGQPREQTIRYEVRPSGVYKKMSAGNYLRLEGGELENFRRAAHTYLALIKQYLYRMA